MPATWLASFNFSAGCHFSACDMQLLFMAKLFMAKLPFHYWKGHRLSVLEMRSSTNWKLSSSLCSSIGTRWIQWHQICWFGNSLVGLEWIHGSWGWVEVWVSTVGPCTSNFVTLVENEVRWQKTKWPSAHVASYITINWFFKEVPEWLSLTSTL